MSEFIRRSFNNSAPVWLAPSQAGSSAVMGPLMTQCPNTILPPLLPFLLGSGSSAVNHQGSGFKSRLVIGADTYSHLQYVDAYASLLPSRLHADYRLFWEAYLASK